MKRTGKSSLLHHDKLRASSEILRALAHPLRMQLLAFIDLHKSVNVNKIYSALGLEQSITSQHLRILRQAGLVRTERDGKFIFYIVDYARVEEAARAVGIFSTFVSEDALATANGLEAPEPA